MYPSLVRIKRNVPLKKLASLKIGGEAKFFAEARSEAEIKEAVLWANKKRLPIFALGGGTNIVLPDEGLSCLVISIRNQEIKRNGNLLQVAAGVTMTKLLETMLSFKLSGLEWAGGLPGTLGGAVRGNAGAFDREMKDNLISVVAMDKQGRIKTLSNKECRFAYRDSIFKHKPLIILSATLRLLPCRDIKKSRESVQEKIEFRQKKQPLEFPNIGSVFKNIERAGEVQTIIKQFPSLEARVKTDWKGKIPAAFLIERAGIKGMSLGGAKVSEKHANFIINYTKEASASDFVNLMELVRQIIKKLYGIKLEPEIEIVIPGIRD